MEEKSVSREWPSTQNGQGVGQLPASVRSSLATGPQWIASASKAGSSTKCFYMFLRDKGRWVFLHGVGRFRSTHSIANRYHKSTYLEGGCTQEISRSLRSKWRGAAPERVSKFSTNSRSQDKTMLCWCTFQKVPLDLACERMD